MGFKEPIEITPRDRNMVRVNCLRCHEILVHAVLDTGGPSRSRLDCLHCHAGAGHGAGD